VIALLRDRAAPYTRRMFQAKPQAFLALPLKDAASRELADQIGEVLRQQDLEPVLASDLGTTPALSDQIQAAVRRAEIVVADLTGANPNVLFEVGLALGLSKPVLLLSQGPANEVPFDLRTQQVAMYRPNDPATVRRYVELWLRDVRSRRQSAAY
jgi:nucleoside 2-deoxyribosyltransferase